MSPLVLSDEEVQLEGIGRSLATAFNPSKSRDRSGLR